MVINIIISYWVSLDDLILLDLLIAKHLKPKNRRHYELDIFILTKNLK